MESVSCFLRCSVHSLPVGILHAASRRIFSLTSKRPAGWRLGVDRLPLGKSLIAANQLRRAGMLDRAPESTIVNVDSLA